MRRLLFCGISLLFFVLSGCVSTPKPEDGKHISVMAYNVENLFDTMHAPGKNDYEYLPMAYKEKHPQIFTQCGIINSARYAGKCRTNDWTETLLSRKLRRLADVIGQINDGRGPDILIMEEVENKALLDRLSQEYLAQAHYRPAVLVQGPDPRGINVGILTRLKTIGQPILHPIDFSKDPHFKGKSVWQTRGILEVTLELPDHTPITVFGVHFPAQGASNEVREFAAHELNRLAAAQPKDRLLIAGGDFNITSKEEHLTHIIANTLAKHWQVSQLVGCDQCRGTVYYSWTQSWSFFDMLLFRPVKDSQWNLDAKSIRVPNDSRFQTNRWGSPARFGSGMEPVGVSDHWPIFAQIYKKKAGVH